MNLGLVGKKGEDMVAAFLKKSGHTIIKRNYISRFGELDIIAKKDGLLLFVEVKTRCEKSMTAPKEAVDSHKIRRMMLTAEDYLSKAEITDELQPRFDVAEVLVKTDNTYHLNYIKNAF